MKNKYKLHLESVGGKTLRTEERKTSSRIPIQGEEFTLHPIGKKEFRKIIDPKKLMLENMFENAYNTYANKEYIVKKVRHSISDCIVYLEERIE